MRVRKDAMRNQMEPVFSNASRRWRRPRTRSCRATAPRRSSTPRSTRSNALSRFTEVSFVVLFIAGGLSVGRMLTDPTWAFSRYIDFGHQLVGEERPINN